MNLVSVWNPSYAIDAMEEHLAILLREASAAGDDVLESESVYVWWGKVRSPNRQQPQANLGDIRRLATRLESEEAESLDLYLTDYRSLYVAEVDEITEGDLPDAERRHAPAYYGKESLNCDFWFCVRDIRRLVVDDMPAVIAELKLLRNKHYHDRPVSLFGGMVDLPLIVTRPDGLRMFEDAERAHVTGGRLWAQFDAEQTAGTAAMERELRDNVLGGTVWSALDITSRQSLASAEKLFRERRSDPSYDFAPVITGFATALEIQTNATLRSALKSISPKARLANVDGRTQALDERGPLSLGQLAHAIGGERELSQALNAVLRDQGWFTGSLPPILEDFRNVRNQAAHAGRIDRKTATYWRNRMLGIGTDGIFAQLARTASR
jgi:hypothetical protein